MVEVEWEEDRYLIESFFEDRSGYPNHFIDSRVKHPKADKWISNEVRILLASFFTKILIAYWRFGDCPSGKHDSPARV